MYGDMVVTISIAYSVSRKPIMKLHAEIPTHGFAVNKSQWVRYSDLRHVELMKEPY